MDNGGATEHHKKPLIEEIKRAEVTRYPDLSRTLIDKVISKS